MAGESKRVSAQHRSTKVSLIRAGISPIVSVQNCTFKNLITRGRKERKANYSYFSQTMKNNL
jgi:hypothetical protein